MTTQGTGGFTLEGLLASATAKPPPSQSRGRANARYAAKKAKAKGAANLAVEPQPLHHRLRGDRWSYEALLLLVTRTRCRGCGEEHVAPSPFPYVARLHPQYGRHLQPISQHCEMQAVFGHLPRRIEYAHVEVDTCHLCFDPLEWEPDRQWMIPFSYEETAQATPDQKMPGELLVTYTPHYTLEHA